jgi:hypothetical protein
MPIHADVTGDYYLTELIMAEKLLCTNPVYLIKRAGWQDSMNTEFPCSILIT